MSRNIYQGAYSRRRFSNYNVVGAKTASASNNSYRLNAVASNPSLGSVQVSSVALAATEVGVASANNPAVKAGAATYQVTALPFSGCRFVGWKGDYPAGKQQSNPIVVTLNRNINLIAVFERIETSYNIIVSYDSSMGRVVASGMQEGRLSATPGTQVTLEATPKDGYVFKQWEGINLAGNVQDNTSRRITITMPARDLTLRAVFAKSAENPGSGGGTPGSGTSDDNGEVVVIDTPTIVSTSGSLTDKVLPFVKKWWWAIAIVAWVCYKNWKEGSK